MIVVVTGSRIWTDVKALREQLLARNPSLVLVGDNGKSHLKSVDAITRYLCRTNGISYEAFDADWDHTTPRAAAGPLRNRRMVNRAIELGAAECLAFSDTFYGKVSGTRGTCQMAVAAGIHTTLYYHQHGKIESLVLDRRIPA